MRPKLPKRRKVDWKELPSLNERLEQDSYENELEGSNSKRIQQTLRRLDQAAGAADATRESRSIGRVGCGSQEVSCDPLSAGDAGGAPAP